MHRDQLLRPVVLGQGRGGRRPLDEPPFLRAVLDRTLQGQRSTLGCAAQIQVWVLDGPELVVPVNGLEDLPAARGVVVDPLADPLTDGRVAGPDGSRTATRHVEQSRAAIR